MYHRRYGHYAVTCGPMQRKRISISHISYPAIFMSFELCLHVHLLFRVVQLCFLLPVLYVRSLQNGNNEACTEQA